MSDMYVSARKHARIKTTVPQPDGSERITTASYNDALSSIKEEIQQNIMSTDATLLADVIKCLRIITEQTSEEMTIRISAEHGRLLITQTWTVEKKYLGHQGFTK